MGNLGLDCVTRAPSSATFDRHPAELYAEVRARVMDVIRLHRESCQALGYKGLFLGGQGGLTTVYGVESITFSATYVAPESTEITRANLATRDSPGKHTADGIEYWLEQVLACDVRVEKYYEYVVALLPREIVLGRVIISTCMIALPQRARGAKFL